MGRELRRVALDFDWPLKKPYEGFLNPHFKPCPEAEKGLCHAGYTNAGKWLGAISRLIGLIGDQAVEARPAFQERIKATGQLYPHPYLREWAHAPHVEMKPSEEQALHAIEDPNERNRVLARWIHAHQGQILPLDEEMVQFVTGLAGRAPDPPFGGNIDWTIETKLKEVAGLDEKWGICPVCQGDAMDPAVKEAYEAWTPTPPPQGEGWQLWETVSEGSPISPVFRTQEGFVKYLIDLGYSEKAAHAFCKSGWVPSAVIADGELYSNIEAAELNREEP